MGGDGKTDDEAPQAPAQVQQAGGLRSVKEIIEFDKRLREVTEGLSRPIRIGSILRLPEIAYGNWGVCLDEGNRLELEDLSARFYEMDADEGKAGRLDRDYLHWLKKSMTRNEMDGMADIMSRLVREMAMSLDDGKRTFRIASIASGAGKLVSAIATAMQEEPESEALLGRTEFHLVDNYEKINQAELNLRGFKARLVPHPVSDNMFLQGGESDFDFMVALSHLHKKPFLAGYLAKLKSKLSEGGVLISGDWHSRLCHSPLAVYETLDRIGIDPSRLNLFDELMRPYMSVGGQRANRLEKAAVEDHINYWQRMDYDLGMLGYRGNCRVRILGAFVSSRQLSEMLGPDGAGLETDTEKIRQAFPKARLPHIMPVSIRDASDSCLVTVAMKKVPGG